MADLSHRQRVERMVFAAHHAHSKSKANNQIRGLGKKVKKNGSR